MEHTVKILYCNAWGYKPRAASLAAKLKDRFDIDAELKVGSAGQFDVLVDDQLVYSRFATGKLPDEELLLESLDL